MTDTAPDLNAKHFDVFLCHNSEDKPEIRQLADELSRMGIRPWLDEREIRPGQQWQVALEEQLQTLKAAAVCVGKSGISPWQQMEIRTVLNQFVKRACPVIPVILSSATETPELPIFLQNFHWVDFRNNHPEPYGQLIRGIAGKKSNDGKEVGSASVLTEPSEDDAEGRLRAPVLNQPDEVDRRQLGILRDRVQEYWVDGVLRQSLYHEVLILLGKRTMDDVVEQPPWKYDVRDLLDCRRNVLPQEYTINTIFDATGLLLILGEPGSGKTTSLLELTAVLINRTKDDPKGRVPIVLNLSSWQTKQSLEEWIVAELSAKYRIPAKIANAWLAKGYLVPLLDGLDEVQTANQPDCVTAINTFIETHDPPQLVVCSRLMEYQWLPKKLKLNGAVCLEPLSPEDVNNFLTAGGLQLAGLQQALGSDPVLQDLAQTPLMLSIMSLACEGADGKALASRKGDSPEARREHIFQLYVERMFERKKAVTSPFSQGEAIGWLSWLARKMKAQSQSVFMLEEIQPIWLSSTEQRWAYEAVTAFSVGLVIASVIVLPIRLDSSPVAEVLLAGLSCTLALGAILFLTCRWASSLINGIITGLSVGVGAFGFFSVIGGSRDGLSSGLLLGLLGGLFSGLGIGTLREIRLVETMRWQWKQFRKKTISGLMIGLFVGLFVGLLDSLRDGDLKRLPGMVLVFGILCSVSNGVSGGMKDTVKNDKVFPNQGITLSLKNGLIALLIFGLIFGQVFWFEPGLSASWILFLSFSMTGCLHRGGSAVLKHYSLRLVLWLTDAIPFRFIPFLDHCAKLILLKKVGGGYMFIHRTLLEYFAALPPQDNTEKKTHRAQLHNSGDQR